MTGAVPVGASGGAPPAIAGGSVSKEAGMIARLSEAISDGLSRSTLQRVPHLILLSDAYYVNSLKPILCELLLLWLRKQGLRDVTDEQAMRCLMSGSLEQSVQAGLSDRHVKMLNLAADWATVMLPHVLRKVSRVHYGLLKPHEMKEMKARGGLPRSRRYLAVPFVGKDAPSHASEFAHPDVAIGLTILAYRYEGLRELDFEQDVISLLRADFEKEVGPFALRKSSQLYASWVEQAGGRIKGLGHQPECDDVRRREHGKRPMLAGHLKARGKWTYL